MGDTRFEREEEMEDTVMGKRRLRGWGGAGGWLSCNKSDNKENEVCTAPISSMYMNPPKGAAGKRTAVLQTYHFLPSLLWNLDSAEHSARRLEPSFLQYEMQTDL